MSRDIHVLTRQLWNSGHPANNDQNRSWSEPWGGSFGDCNCGGHGWPPHGQASCEGLSNTTCDDENIAKWTLGRLERAANGTLDPSGKPFFVAAGFRAAHFLCRNVCSPYESNSAHVYVWCLCRQTTSSVLRTAGVLQAVPRSSTAGASIAFEGCGPALARICTFKVEI